MLTRLSNNSIRKGGREKKCRGLSVRAECRAPRSPYSFNFASLKTSQRFILQELSHVSKRQKDNMALYTSTERNTSVVLLQHYFWGTEFRGDYNIHCDSII